LKVIANFLCIVRTMFRSESGCFHGTKPGCRKPRRHVKSNPVLRDGHRGGAIISLKVIANLEMLFTRALAFDVQLEFQDLSVC
jgi:hypothetical protein